MSGVLIQGMKMPTSCDGCWALDDYGDYPRCRITEEQRGYNFQTREKRMDKCPLIPVSPHGRLIDADALMEILSKVIEINASIEQRNEATDQERRCLWWFEQQIRIAPTIIQAEEGVTHDASN